MEAELGMEIGYRPQPSLIGAEKEAHIPELRKLYEEKKEAGLDIRWLQGRELRELEPNLKPGTVLAATYYEQGSIYPFHYLYAMIKAARAYGLTVLENTPVDSLLLEAGACKGVVLKDGRTLRGRACNRRRRSRHTQALRWRWFGRSGIFRQGGGSRYRAA